MDGGLPELLRDPSWQMPFGERAVIEGVLTTLKPALSVEIGTAQGGSLRRISAHSDEVHAFDLDLSRVEGIPTEKVHLHEGDSRELLPEVLARFAEQGRSVDFALIDGDHSSDGVHADVKAFLESPATAGSVILLHDTMNAAVREGIRRALDDADPSPPHSLDLDFVAGLLSVRPPFQGLWGGLGILLVGVEMPLALPHFDLTLLLGAERELREAAGEPGDSESLLLAKIDQQQAWLRQMHDSASWRITAPLRALKRAFRRPPLNILS